MCLLVCALAVVLAVAVLVAYLGWQQGPEHDLAGKVVLLTGAAGGLGRELALSLARRGCRLACADVATKPNEETASMVGRSGRPHVGQPLAKAYTVDLCSGEAIAALVKDVVADFGRVDVLVNCAGQLQGGRLWDMTDDQLDRVFDVNLRAVALLVRAVLPHMRARRAGHIVTISSMAGCLATSHTAVYSASKAGVSHLMECLYRDLHYEGLHDDIHVTTVHPYFINTFADLKTVVKVRGVARWLMKLGEPEAAVRAITKSIATRQHVVNLPGHLGPLTAVISRLPRQAQSWVIQNLVRPDINVYTYATPDKRT